MVEELYCPAVYELVELFSDKELPLVGYGIALYLIRGR
jgi:hypothetical protein